MNQELLMMVPLSNVEALFRLWEDAVALEIGDGAIPAPSKLTSATQAGKVKTQN